MRKLFNIQAVYRMTICYCSIPLPGKFEYSEDTGFPDYLSILSSIRDEDRLMTAIYEQKQQLAKERQRYSDTYKMLTIIEYMLVESI